ncbi:conserved hypothetical protein [Catenulispora acidiphila DSM 44928]|uniref:Lipoprotein n=1 Tax=Catenulispora acidiphila (strain DSM 44928 / JCM 14897 / NBRC 102108 / NRRL B-24433 / ID139908) TaxID=479433 RepID=C7QII3_CATAD|nr:hypothetical protein [Catenulispora acidiphila]ACU75060.1 conserved hypothetical protein [Catenulispora acidiphila DSM 44928]
MRTRTGLCAVASAGVLILTAAGCGSSSSSPKTASAAASGGPEAGSAAGTPSAPASGSASTPTPTQTPAPPSTPQTPSSSPSADPGTLPQIKALPTATDPQFTAGVNALWQGIVDDNPQEALPFFFPKSAYLQVKALSNAGADYENRLIGFYNLDIHAAHRLLGSGAKDAKLVGVSVPAKAAEWIVPGVEQNKLSYYRVYGSRLTYTEGGKTKSFGLFSLISWRGQWYVVHFGPNPRPASTGVVYEPRG